MRQVAIALLLLSVTTSSAAQPDTTSQSVEVGVDPRIELMGVVQLLTEYPLVTDFDSPYKKDVQAYFSGSEGHPAAKLFEKMDGEGFAFDAVPKAMLSLTNPPALAPRVPYPERAVSAAGGADSLRQFVDALRDLARHTDFQAFYRSHKGTYRALADSARGVASDAMGALRDYMGTPLKNATVVLGPLLHNGGFAARYETEEGEEAYAFIGPTGVEDGIPTFGSPERLASLTWHEFSHTVVNPLTHEYREDVNGYASLFASIREPMRKAGYTNWETVVNEHIIRAIEVRLAHRRFGEEAGRRKLEEQKKRGFQYIEPLIQELKTYEVNRDAYPTLSDFYPRIIDGFEDAASHSR